MIKAAWLYLIALDGQAEDILPTQDFCPLTSDHGMVTMTGLKKCRLLRYASGKES